MLDTYIRVHSIGDVHYFCQIMPYRRENVFGNFMWQVLNIPTGEGVGGLVATLEAAEIAIQEYIQEEEKKAMLKDFYVTYEVYDGVDFEYLFCGGENLAAADQNDAIEQVKAKFGRYGKVVIQEVEPISDDPEALDLK